MANGDYLYHGSIKSGLKTITPQKTLSKDQYIGDYIFATRSEIMAAMYLLPHELGTQLIGHDKIPPYLVIQTTSERYEELDRGGSIYTLPQTSFHSTPQVELDDSELASEIPATPLREERYDRAIDAFARYGIKLFLLSESDFDRVLQAKDKAWNVLRHLNAYEKTIN